MKNTLGGHCVWVAIMCLHVVAAQAQVVETPTTPAGVAPKSDESPSQEAVAAEGVDMNEAGVSVDMFDAVEAAPQVPAAIAPPAAPTVVTPPPVAPAVAPIPAPVAAPVVDQPSWMDGLKVTPQLQLRAREELIGHPYVGTEGSYILATRYRARGGLTLERDALTVRLELQSVGNFGEALGPANAEATFGLHQGYFQLTSGGYWLRLGRQEMAFGDQRMIGVLDWMMSARSFDALRLHSESGQWTVDAFGAVTRAQADYRDPVCLKDPMRKPEECDQTHASGDYLGGLYSTWKDSDAFATDLYLLFRHDGANPTDWQFDRDVASPGVRAFGEISGFLRYKSEAIVQIGHTLGAGKPRRAHQAAALLGELGVELDRDATAIMAVGGAYATGQTTGKWTEFENFFPANHKIYGVADLIGLRNLQQEYAMFSWTKPSLHLQGFFAGHVLSLATADGRWSNAPGNDINKMPTPGKSRFLGTNWDAVIRYTPSTNVWVEAGYSLFIPDAAAERYGKTQMQHFLYVWTEAKLP